MSLQRDVPPRDRAFHVWMEGAQRSIDALHRRPVARVDDAGEIRLGDAILRFDTQADGTVEMTARNANTNGPRVTIAVLT